MLLRPEQILVHHDGTGARVEQVHFYGHDASVRLRVLPDGPAVVARVSGLEAPAPGSEVGIGVTGPVVAFPVG